MKKRNLGQYFVETHGFPRKKQEIVQDIASRHFFRMKNCLFIGDATTDFEAALICGTSFLGIVKKGEESPFPESTRVSSFVHVNLE